MRRRFSTASYPKFGKQKYDENKLPKTVTNSPYFHWFRFMQLYYSNNNKIHAVFGDIRQLNFKQFWNKFDTYFLEEQTKEYSFKIAKNQTDIVPFNSEDAVNVVVPLKNWTKSNLRKHFEKNVISKVSEGKKGIHVEDSTAEYKLNSRYRISAFERAYDVYTVKEYYEDYTWYDVAVESKCFDRIIQATLTTSDDYKGKRIINVGDLKPLTVTAKNMGMRDVHFGLRNTLTALAIRHYKRALNFINASVTKNFP